jgi:hypothetical protein
MKKYVYALLFALVPFAAFSQDTNVQIGGLWGTARPYIADLLGLLVVAALGYISTIAKAKLGISIDEGLRASLHQSAVTGINMALGQLNGRMDNLSVDVKNKVLADALNYLVKAAPDAIKHFGLDEKRDVLMDMLKAKLTVALPGPNA